MTRIRKTIVLAALAVLAFPAVTRAAGQGYFEFSVPSTTSALVAGLDSTATVTDPHLDFGLSFNTAGTAEVREDGTYFSETNVTAGDTFRVGVSDGYVTYSKNGSVFFSSNHTASYPLYARVSLWSTGSAIENGTISHSDGATTEAVNWTGLLNATATFADQNLGLRGLRRRGRGFSANDYDRLRLICCCHDHCRCDGICGIYHSPE